jgi:hypothetical protein
MHIYDVGLLIFSVVSMLQPLRIDVSTIIFTCFTMNVACNIQCSKVFLMLQQFYLDVATVLSPYRICFAIDLHYANF